MVNFYDILRVERGDSQFSAFVRLNKDHEIYRGHFPGSPVVPGVCMIRMVHELLQELKSRKLRLSSADNIKFLAVINPFEVTDLSVNIDLTTVGDQFMVHASIVSEPVVYFKFKGIFTTT